MYKKTVGILGGDMRHFHLYRLLLKKGYDAKIYGFDNLCPNDSLDAVLNCQKLVLPIPVSRDNISISSLYSSEDIKISDIKQKIGAGTVVYGGIICRSLKDISQPFIDYYTNESFVNYNALLTAEGAISVMMNNTAFSLKDSKVLVVGYGRIGKYVSKLLKCLGVNVTVSARKEEDFKDISLNSCKSIDSNSLIDYDFDADVIINTVPHRLFSEEILKKINRDCLFIELASPPYSLDFNLASDMGITLLNAQGLPSKYAPLSCAHALLSVIFTESKRGEYNE